jgi:hypothetical protein
MSLKDPQKLRDLIVDTLNLADVMLAYKVSFAYDPHLASEVQFKCPIHGKDSKPSARLYNSTKSCYCWVCRKSWDVVSFVKDMEKLSYNETLDYIIKRYRIDTSSIPETPELGLPDRTYSVKEVDVIQIRSNIIDLRQKIPFEKYRALCAAFFMTEYAISKGADSTESLNKIQDKILCLKSQP